MTDTARVDDEDLPQRCPVAGGLGEELPLDVVDDDGVLPAEKLARRQEPLATPGRGNDEHVPELSPLPGGANLKKMLMRDAAKEQTCRGWLMRHDAGQFMQPRKPCDMEMPLCENASEQVAQEAG